MMACLHDAPAAGRPSTSTNDYNDEGPSGDQTAGGSMAGLRVTVGDVVVTVQLNTSRTAGLLSAALPFEAKAQRWGDEVYFETPVKTGAEDPQAEVPSGTVAYWPPGHALCLFFGQTPYSPVNVVGRIEGDPAVLARVKDGQHVQVEPA
jgi:hypothetical protein